MDILSSGVGQWSFVWCGVWLSSNWTTFNTGSEYRLDVLSGGRNPISSSEICECGVGTGMVEVAVNIPDDQLGEWMLSWNEVWKLCQILQWSIMDSTTTT